MYKGFDRVKDGLGKAWYYGSKSALVLYDAALANDILHIVSRTRNNTPLTTFYIWHAMMENGLNPGMEINNFPVSLAFVLFLASSIGAPILTYHAFKKNHSQEKMPPQDKNSVTIADNQKYLNSKI